MSYQIRKVIDEDLDSLSQMFMSAYAGEPWRETWRFEQAKERILEVFSCPKSLCYVYEDNGLITGCVLSLLISWHTGLQLEGKELFVDPRQQRQGIGERLMRHVGAVAAELGATEFFFWTVRDLPSDRLVNYYRKLGFDIVDDRVIMARGLTGSRQVWSLQ